MTEAKQPDQAEAHGEPKSDVAAPGVSLLELREDQCKFPISGTIDTVYRFCGAATGGHVYCPHHRELAYARPLQPKR
jgi:hypothetical protein